MKPRLERAARHNPRPLHKNCVQNTRFILVNFRLSFLPFLLFPREAVMSPRVNVGGLSFVHSAESLPPLSSLLLLRERHPFRRHNPPVHPLFFNPGFLVKRPKAHGLVVPVFFPSSREIVIHPFSLRSDGPSDLRTSFVQKPAPRPIGGLFLISFNSFGSSRRRERSLRPALTCPCPVGGR